MSAWLLGGTPRLEDAAPEQRVDLPTPTPVYITYLTARASADRVTFATDVYGRDPRLIAAIEHRASQAKMAELSTERAGRPRI